MRGEPADPAVRHREEGEAGVLGFALLTVSDSRRAADDRSGAVARALVEGAGHRVVAATIVPDEIGSIRDRVADWLADPGCDVILVTGGTGAAPRDRTPEALVPLLERELPGFGELFRALSFAEVGPAAMLSRATAGVARGRALFLLPGSPAAVELALARLVLPEIGHLLAQARRRD